MKSPSKKPLCIVYADNETFIKPDVQRFIRGLRDEGVKVAVRNPQYYKSSEREPADAVYVQLAYINLPIARDYEDDDTDHISILEEAIPRFVAYEEQLARLESTHEELGLIAPGDERLRSTARVQITNPYLDPAYVRRLQEAGHDVSELLVNDGVIEPRDLKPGEKLESAPLPEGTQVVVVETTMDASGSYPIGETATPAPHGVSADARSPFACDQPGHDHASAEEAGDCIAYYSKENLSQSNTAPSNTPATPTAAPAKTPLSDQPRRSSGASSTMLRGSRGRGQR